MNEGTKDSAKRYVTNEQLLDQMEVLTRAVKILIEDIDIIKKKVGFNDKTVSAPERRNYNTDPGPFQKSNK